MSALPKPCVFLDRDGTVIAEKHYLHDPDEVELLPGAVAGLAAFRHQGFALVLITNQSGVERGMYTREDVAAVHARLGALLALAGVSLDGIYYCPHRPDQLCACRKPSPGLLRQAARELNLDMSRSVMIGDKPCDIAAGQACDLLTVLVTTGYGEAGATNPDATVADLAQAAAWLALRP